MYKLKLKLKTKNKKIQSNFKTFFGEKLIFIFKSYLMVSTGLYILQQSSFDTIVTKLLCFGTQAGKHKRGRRVFRVRAFIIIVRIVTTRSKFRVRCAFAYWLWLIESRPGQDAIIKSSSHQFHPQYAHGNWFSNYVLETNASETRCSNLIQKKNCELWTFQYGL